MRTVDYSRPRASAERLIKRYGRLAQIRRATRSGRAYDPVIVTTDYSCRIAEDSYEFEQIDGTRIRAADRRFYLSTEGLAIEPAESDQLVIGGVVHEVVKVAPLSPGDVVVFWEIQARR